MTWAKKLLVVFALLLVAFAGGAYVGYQHGYSTSHVQTVFTPYEDGIGSYLSFIDKAKKSVHVAGYAFTDQRIVDKLIELHKDRRVAVHVLVDQSQTRGFSADSEWKAIDALRAAGIEVVIGTSERSHEIMHMKYTVVDGIAVEDGSWNYTKLANLQANTLNFDYDPVRAKSFMSNWERMAKFMRTQPQARPEPKDDDADKATNDDKPTRRPRKR